MQVYSLAQNDIASLASKMLVSQTLVFAKSPGAGGYRRGLMQECRLPLFSLEALAASLRKRICCLPLVNFQSPDNLGQFCPVLHFFFVESSHQTLHAPIVGSPPLWIFLYSSSSFYTWENCDLRRLNHLCTIKSLLHEFKGLIFPLKNRKYVGHGHYNKEAPYLNCFTLDSTVLKH